MIYIVNSETLGTDLNLSLCFIGSSNEAQMLNFLFDIWVHFINIHFYLFFLYNTAPNTNIPILSLYILLNCEIGSGFSPSPASIVYPGLLYS